MLLSFLLLATFVLYYLTFFYFRCALGYMGFPFCQRCNCSIDGSTNKDPCLTPCVCKVATWKHRHPHWQVLCVNLSSSFISAAPSASHLSTPSLLPSVMPAGKCRRRKLWPLQSGVLQSSKWQSAWLWKVLLYGCVQSLHWIHMDLSKCR